MEGLPQGPVRQLATHCVLEGREEAGPGERFRLALDPAFASLRTPRREERLRQALEALVGHPVRLALRVAEGGAPTPAARRREQEEARRRAAEEALRRDETLRAFQELLDASVVPGSLRPAGE